MNFHCALPSPSGFLRCGRLRLKLSRLSICLVGTMLSVGTPAPGNAVRDHHVVAELIPEVTGINPGSPFTTAIRLQHDAHWHSYWKNPVVGYPTSVTWNLPDGYSAGPIRWPVPKVLNSLGVITYGYEGEVFLPVEITPSPDTAPGTLITLGADVGWLMCSDICIPGKAQLELSLPVGREESSLDPHRRVDFATARDRLPRESSSWEATAFREGDQIRLFLEAKRGPQLDAGEVYFFSSDGQVEATETQDVRSTASGYLIDLTTAAYPSDLDTDQDILEGVAVASKGWTPAGLPTGLAISARLHDGPVPDHIANHRQGTISTAPSASTAPDEGASTSLILVLFLAFVGGLILNLMPCVFPVLGLKVMHFVSKAGEDPKQVTAHGVIFAAGVLVSFWVLAVILNLLRTGGNELGWGFQLQSPIFVFVLAVLLFVFALNLSGLFEVGTSATGLGSDLVSLGGYPGSFFSGILATVVATPCAAPFLATALGAALTIPFAQSLLIFTSIGLGLALPYLILSVFPHLVSILPRPGRWMESFKQVMAFPLYASAGFLLWVLAGQVDEFSFLGIILSFVVVALAGWIYGRWSTPENFAWVRRLGRAGSLLTLLCALYLGFPRMAVANLTWDVWSPEKVSELRAQDRPIFIDFTARWCATCQTNKKLVLASNKVERAFRRKGIVALKADWTNQDPRITAALADFNRFAVPFNVIYPPGRGDPIVLPELLTPRIVLDALAEF